MWYDTLAGFLQVTLGFKVSQTDRCVFVRHKCMGNVRSTCVILVYVDDVLVFGSASTVSEVPAALRARYPLTNDAPDYLGMHRVRDFGQQRPRAPGCLRCQGRRGGQVRRMPTGDDATHHGLHRSGLRRSRWRRSEHRQLDRFSARQWAPRLSRDVHGAVAVLRARILLIEIATVGRHSGRINARASHCSRTHAPLHQRRMTPRTLVHTTSRWIYTRGLLRRPARPRDAPDCAWLLQVAVCFF